MTPLEQLAIAFLDGLEEHYTQNKIDRLTALLRQVEIEAKIQAHECYAASYHSPSWAECRLSELRAQLAKLCGGD